MREKVYVDRLFADYENSQNLRDFKEEIAVNLRERVKEFVSEGMQEDEAFEAAAAELGDITAIADDAAKQTRTETIGQMYMKAKVPLSKRTAAGLAGATGLLLIALGIALLSFFGKNEAALYNCAAILLSAAAGLYAYFGLTQEITAHYAMKNGRALAYGVICTAGVLGAGLAVVSFALKGWDMSAALGVTIALLLPAICGLIFLLATQPKRYKPWLKTMIDRETEASVKHPIDIVDPVKAAKFGVMSGALWLFVIAVFVMLGMVVDWHISWLPFLFALPVQVCMVSGIFQKK